MLLHSYSFYFVFFPFGRVWQITLPNGKTYTFSTATLYHLLFKHWLSKFLKQSSVKRNWKLNSILLNYKSEICELLQIFTVIIQLLFELDNQIYAQFMLLRGISQYVPVFTFCHWLQPVISAICSIIACSPVLPSGAAGGALHLLADHHSAAAPDGAAGPGAGAAAQWAAWRDAAPAPRPWQPAYCCLPRGIRRRSRQVGVEWRQFSDVFANC